MPDPIYTISIEFVTGSFTNVSSDVLRFTCERQVADMFKPLSPSNATVELANEYGKYSPLNAGSPYYPNLRSQKRLQMTAEYPSSNFALSFDNTNHAVASLSSTLQQTLSAVTFECWVKVNSFSAGESFPLGNYDGEPGTWLWAFGAVGTSYWASRGNATWVASLGNAVNAGDWNHLAMSVTGGVPGSLCLFKNGAQVLGIPNSCYPVLATFDFGRLPNSAIGFSNCQVDEARTYDRALTPQELASHAVGSFDAQQAGLLNCWRFNEGSGSVAHDYGPMAMNATLVGSPAWVVTSLAVNPSGGLRNFLFTGFIKEVGTNVGRAQRTTVVQAEDGINRLDNSFVTTSLFASANPASFFTAVMSLCGVNSFAVEALVDVIPFAWARDRKASAVVQDILNFGYYQMYQDGAGTVQLKNRFGPLATSAASLSEFAEFQYQQNEDQLLNSAKLAATPRAVSPTTNTVAWLATVLALPSSSGIGFWLSYVDPTEVTVTTPATSMVAPVSSADYLTNTQSDGAGADGTSVTSASVTFFGEAAVCSLWNGGGSQLFVTKFQLRGNSARRQSAFASLVDNSSSQAVYGKHAFDLEGNPFLGEKTYVDAYAQALVLDRKEERPQLTVSIKNDFASIFALEVAQLVSLVEPVSAVNGQYAVRMLVHDVQLVNGLEHALRLEVDTYVSKNNLILDNAVFGKLDSGNTLAF